MLHNTKEMYEPITLGLLQKGNVVVFGTDINSFGVSWQVIGLNSVVTSYTLLLFIV